MKILEILRNQPLYVRKIILWICVIIVAAVGLYLTIRNLQKNVNYWNEYNPLEKIRLPEFTPSQNQSMPKSQDLNVDLEQFQKLLLEPEKQLQSENYPNPSPTPPAGEPSPTPTTESNE